MLTRRHIRVKVMQCIYALVQSQDDSLQKQEKFLDYSIENMYSLYLVMLSLFAELHKTAENQLKLSVKKYLATTSDEYPDKNKFLKNRILQQISGNALLKDRFSERKLEHWNLNGEYVKILFKEIINSDIYKDYMLSEDSSYEEDRSVVVALFKDIIAPNEKIQDYFEDDKLTWVDDIPIVNTFLLKQFKKIRPDQKENFFLPNLLKDDSDMGFAKNLLSKTLLNNAELEKEIEGKTPNWDNDRIAEIDSILLKMAISELLNFSSIPEKVTLNEYLEIAKEYSTPRAVSL